MTVRNIDRNSWREELDSFTRQHERWIVSITTRGPQGDVAVAARDVPLRSVSFASPESEDIVIIVGDGRTRLTREVDDPAALQIDLTTNQAERALIIHGNDGTTTTIEFRSPVRPEEVDGIPALDHRLGLT
jgi:hypothetical protein